MLVSKLHWTWLITQLLCHMEIIEKFVGEYKNEMHLMFPQPLADILGVDKTYFGKPIGNDKYQFKNGVD